jgi:hypothetical protein
MWKYKVVRTKISPDAIKSLPFKMNRNLAEYSGKYINLLILQISWQFLGSNSEVCLLETLLWTSHYAFKISTGYWNLIAYLFGNKSVRKVDIIVTWETATLACFGSNSSWSWNGKLWICLFRYYEILDNPSRGEKVTELSESNDFNWIESAKTRQFNLI